MLSDVGILTSYHLQIEEGPLISHSQRTHCMSLYCVLSLHFSKNILGAGGKGLLEWRYKLPVSTVFLVRESQRSEPRVPPLLNGVNSTHLEFSGFNEKTRPG